MGWAGGLPFSGSRFLEISIVDCVSLLLGGGGRHRFHSSTAQGMFFVVLG